ncbi:MAG: alanine racemase, partial [Deltaproteobacteria bacterium]|nr:alanine racemase [Deltaproteobacteria bacterium]
MKGFSSWLEIDLDNLGHNLDQISEHVGVTVMAVVKNNAYGHGIIPVTAYLESRGVKWCMVAKLYEALKIREAGITMDVLNMDVLFTESQYDSVVGNGITQCVYTREDANNLAEAA